MKSLHKDIVDIVCPYCKVRFPEAMIKHIIDHETDEVITVCDGCYLTGKYLNVDKSQ